MIEDGTAQVFSSPLWCPLSNAQTSPVPITKTIRERERNNEPRQQAPVSFFPRAEPRQLLTQPFGGDQPVKSGWIATGTAGGSGATGVTGVTGCAVRPAPNP